MTESSDAQEPREGVNALIRAVKSQPGKRAPYYAEQLGRPVKTVERWLKTLRDNKRIVFRGAPKTGGYYTVGKKVL
jgi:ATP-dependent DNA helicase RecG